MGVQSEEDLALKQQLELYVERVQDTDPGLQKVALESMRYLLSRGIRGVKIDGVADNLVSVWIGVDSTWIDLIACIRLLIIVEYESISDRFEINYWIGVI